MIEKDIFRDAKKSKEYLQKLMDELHGEGEGYVETYYSQNKDTLFVVKVMPKHIANSPIEGELPVRYYVYNSSKYGLFKDKSKPCPDGNIVALAKSHMDTCKAEYAENPQLLTCNYW